MLNQRLRDNGFAGLPASSCKNWAANQSPAQYQLSQQDKGTEAPSTETLYAALDSVLTQYDRRAHLVQELLSASDLARERESRVDDIIKHLRR